MTAIDRAALRALAEKATPGMASAMASKQIGDATAAIVALRDAMHPAAVLALLDENARLREALRAAEVVVRAEGANATLVIVRAALGDDA